jgi:hypothetical protein
VDDPQVGQWRNLQQLEEERRGNQWGFTCLVASTIQADDVTPPGVLVEGAQVIKWASDQWNPNAWRVYLGPWTPKSEMRTSFDVADGIVPDLAIPSLDGIAGQGQLQLPKLLSFASPLQVFARVIWGTGGAKHQAYVDWPHSGLLFQVSGSYVEVNGVALLLEPIDDDALPEHLPKLSATLSNEPGGGDASAAGTLTYPFQQGDWAGGQSGINFEVPPFARSIRFIWDNTKNGDDPNYASSAIIQFYRSRGDGLDGEYVYTWTAGDIGDPREPLAIPALTAYVRVDFTWTDIPAEDRTAGVGAIFELDL